MQVSASISSLMAQKTHKVSSMDKLVPVVCLGALAHCSQGQAEKPSSRYCSVFLKSEMGC